MITLFFQTVTRLLQPSFSNERDSIHDFAAEWLVRISFSFPTLLSFWNIFFRLASAAHHRAVTGGEKGTRRDQQRCRRYNLREGTRGGESKTSSLATG